MTDSTAPLLNEQSKLVQIATNLHMRGFAEALLAQFGAPQLYANMTFEQRLEKCLIQQIETNKDRQFCRLFRASLLERKYYLSQFSTQLQPGLTAEDLTLLHECNYIHKCINIIINGATGTGKTALSIAAAIAAMRQGFSVRFYRMNDLALSLNSLSDEAFLRLKTKFKSIRLLVLDDFGCTHLEDLVVNRLNDLVDARYHVGSTIITSQLKRLNLKDVIAQSVVRDAIFDRLLRDNDRTITLQGASWRGQAGEMIGGEHV